MDSTHKDPIYLLRKRKRKKYFSNNSLKTDLNKIIGNNNRKWTKQENSIFINSLINNRNEWNRLEDFLKTRNKNQIRSHAQKFFEKLSFYLSDENKKFLISPEFFSKFIFMINEMKKEKIKYFLSNLNQNDLTDNKDNVIIIIFNNNSLSF